MINLKGPTQFVLTCNSCAICITSTRPNSTEGENFSPNTVYTTKYPAGIISLYTLPSSFNCQIIFGSLLLDFLCANPPTPIAQDCSFLKIYCLLHTPHQKLPPVPSPTKPPANFNNQITLYSSPVQILQPSSVIQST